MDIKHKETNNSLIDESSSIGKIFSHITNKTCFGTITAFSDKYTLQQNLKRNTKLESDIYYLRFCFNKFRGYFIENNGQDPAVEEVLIVYSMPDRQKELNDFLKSACRYYDQDAILLAAGGEASLWHKDGTEENLGSFHIDPAELRQAYSAIKGKPFRFGDPRCAGQDESSSLNECLAECVPSVCSTTIHLQVHRFYGILTG